MNPFAQVWHVMAKDISQARWAILVYVGIVALATGHALGWLDSTFATLDLGMIIVVIAGLVVTANIVQADSPIRSDAFWASRPLHPTAVLGAKAILVVLIVLGLPLLGQGIVFLRNDIAGAKFVRLLGESATMYAVWLLIAMLLGALTRDLRSFTTLVLGAPVVLVVANLGRLLLSRDSESPSALLAARLLSIAFVLVGVCGAIALLITLYRTRSASKLTWAGAIVAILAMFATLFVSLPTRATATEQGRLVNGTAQVFVELMDMPGAPTRLSLGVSKSGNSERLVMLDSAAVTLRTADGSTVELPMQLVALALTTPKLLEGNGLRWVGYSPPTAPETRTGLDLSRREAEQLRKGIVSATIVGRTWSATPSVQFTMPFNVGETRRRDGRALRIVEAAQTMDRDSIGVVSMTTIEGSRSEAWLDAMRRTSATPQYVLVNEARHEWIMPNTNVNGGSSESLVLPGVGRSERSSHLHLFPGSTKLIDDGWLGNAKLVAFGWKMLGNAPMNVEATVRSPIGVSAGARRQSEAGTPPASRLLRIRTP